MAVIVPPRVSGGVEPGHRVLQRQARPLNGIEIGKAIKSHLKDMAYYLLLRQEYIEVPSFPTLTDPLIEQVDTAIGLQARLQKMNTVYPKVGWLMRLRLQEDESDLGSFHLTAECELDLDHNVRILLHFGDATKGRVIDTHEDERLSTSSPDNLREKSDLPIDVQVMAPDGQVKTVDLRDVAPKRAARRVDVGQAATKPVEVAPAELIEVVTPEMTDSITLDLEPPKVEVAAPAVPPPVRKPNAKMGGRR